MKLSVTVACLSFVVAQAAMAQGNKPAQPPGQMQPSKEKATAPQGQVDLTKMGPWTRKLTNENAVKKEITAFIEQDEKVYTSGNFEAAVANVDFPVTMLTDNSQGAPMAKDYSRDEYVAMMKPMFDNRPKDMTFKHRPTVTPLSDSLAVVVDDYTVNTGKQRMAGRSSGMLVKRNGQWKWKVLAEAGWGDAAATGGSGSGSGSSSGTGAAQPGAPKPSH